MNSPAAPPDHSTDLLDALRESRGSTLVVTGAGVSLASGIPTFRGSDPGAVWASTVAERGTLAFFQNDPVESWRWYLGRFAAMEGAEPNAGHRAIVGLERFHRERGRGFVLVTQNVDGLHAAAGSEALVEVHGNAATVRCARDGCEHGAPRGTLPASDFDFGPFVAEPSYENVPKCPACDGIIRPHVLWFDELYDGHRAYRIDEVYRAAKSSAVILFVGTSFAVGVTDSILAASVRRARQVFSIDPSGRVPHRRVQVIGRTAEVVLPELIEALTSA